MFSRRRGRDDLLTTFNIFFMQTTFRIDSTSMHKIVFESSRQKNVITSYI